MYKILLADAIGPTWADMGTRSNTCEYRTRLSISLKINSRTSHRVVVEVVVFREAIMEEEETEEGAGQEELVAEAEAEAESVDRTNHRPRDHDQDLQGYKSERGCFRVCLVPLRPSMR